MKKEDEYQIVLERKQDGKKFIGNPEYWEKLKDLPDPKDYLALYQDFHNFKSFFHNQIRETITTQILDYMKYRSYRYTDFFTSTRKSVIGSMAISNIIHELLNNGIIEKTPNGWYRLPKKEA